MLVPGALPVLVPAWTARMPSGLKFTNGRAEVDLGSSKATVTVPATITVPGTGTLPTRIDCSVRGAALTDTDLYFLKACLNAVYDVSDTNGYAVLAWADQTIHPTTTPAGRHGYQCAEVTVTVLVEQDTAELSILPGDPNRTSCAETAG